MCCLLLLGSVAGAWVQWGEAGCEECSVVVSVDGVWGSLPCAIGMLVVGCALIGFLQPLFD